MKTYSVKEIADLLGTNPETVRRWIRNGKLHAVQESRKDGNSVTEAELNKFLKATPKYAAIAGKSVAFVAPMVGVSMAIGGLIGELVVDYVENDNKAKNARVSPKEIIKHLRSNILAHETAIQKKRDAIAQLEAEIEAEKQQIQALEATIKTVNSQIKEG